jgi:hypothetical protein
VLQHLEKTDMASDHHGDQRAAPERKPLKDSPSSSRPSPQNGPPLFNDGPESLRSSHC